MKFINQVEVDQPVVWGRFVQVFGKSIRSVTLAFDDMELYVLFTSSYFSLSSCKLQC